MYKVVTVIYYEEASLELQAQCQTFELSQFGRVIIPNSFKEGKSIIAVCDGKVEILNKIGDRVVSENMNLKEISKSHLHT